MAKTLWAIPKTGWRRPFYYWWRRGKSCWIHKCALAKMLPSILPLSRYFCNALVCVWGGKKWGRKKKNSEKGRELRHTGKRQWQSTHGSIRLCGHAEREEGKNTFSREWGGNQINQSARLYTNWLIFFIVSEITLWNQVKKHIFEAVFNSWELISEGLKNIPRKMMAVVNGNMQRAKFGRRNRVFNRLMNRRP